MNDEQMLNVPLKPEVKKLLEQQADEDGRATGRQAARYVEDAVFRRAEKKG